MIFLLYLVNVMDYTNCFLNIKTALHIWNKFYLVMVYHSFYTLLGCILLHIFASMFMRESGLLFSFLVILVLG